MNSNVTATDDTWIALINAFLTHPLLMFEFFVLLWISYIVYKDRAILFDFLKSIFRLKKKKIQKKDLIEHQIFKDLDFWIEHKVDQAYNPDVNTKYDRAKVTIARDLLLIKFKSVKQWLTYFITNTDFDDPYLNIRSALEHKIEKYNSIEYSEYKKEGIPLLFIEKWMEISRIHENYLQKCLIDLLSTKIPLDIYEKVYIVLGNLLTYYNTMLIEMNTVIHSINGDLKGQVYKTMVIGGNDYRCYPVPSREYIPLVENKLQEILTISKASRASIYIFHDVPDEDYQRGYFSKLYEYSIEGLKPYMLECQYKPNSILSDLLVHFKQHQGFVKPVSELGEIGTIVKKSGMEVLAAFPMFLDDRLKGFITISYPTEKAIDDEVKEEDLKLLKKYSCLLNTYIDYSKTGFSYKNNAVKE